MLSLLAPQKEKNDENEVFGAKNDKNGHFWAKNAENDVFGAKNDILYG